MPLWTFTQGRRIMKFEVINDKNKTVMSTDSPSCIPDKGTLDSISKAGYKFKLDGKITTIKKLNEQLKEIGNVKND